MQYNPADFIINSVMWAEDHDSLQSRNRVDTNPRGTRGGRAGMGEGSARVSECLVFVKIFESAQITTVKGE